MKNAGLGEVEGGRGGARPEKIAIDGKSSTVLFTVAGWLVSFSLFCGVLICFAVDA